MPSFADPTTRLRSSFLAAVAEFRADQDTPLPPFVRAVPPAALEDEPAFGAYVAFLLVQPREETPRPPRMVPMTTLWWVEGEEFLGRLAIRHRLTPELEIDGGHIGYDVRPTARRRGHATAMLTAGLPIARDLGIDEAVLTCAETNVASRRVIEAHGGRYRGSAGGKRSYLVPTRLR